MSQTPESPPPPAADPPETRRMMGGFSIAATLFFLAVWLGPITYVGSAGRDIGWMHRDLRHMQRVACLFTNEVGAWGTYHIEIKPEPGADWVELPLDGYFDMSIFGYRTRFHRLLGKSYRRGGGRARTQYMARWIADRYARLHPAAPPLQGMRFVSASRTVAELLQEEGRFHKLPLSSISPRRRRVLMTFEGHPLEYVPPPRRRGLKRRGAKGAGSKRPARQPVRRAPVERPPADGTRPPDRPALQPIRRPSGAGERPTPRLNPLPGNLQPPSVDRPAPVPLRALPVPGRQPAPKAGE